LTAASPPDPPTTMPINFFFFLFCLAPVPPPSAAAVGLYGRMTSMHSSSGACGGPPKGDFALEDLDPGLATLPLSTLAPPPMPPAPVPPDVLLPPRPLRCPLLLVLECISSWLGGAGSRCRALATPPVIIL